VPPGSTKLLGLLAFIAAAPGRRASREQLVDLLWDDGDLKHARANLRQALHRLRQSLGTDYLPTGDDDIQLTDRLVCDRDEFIAALAAGDLEEAIARYGGEYIPGFVSRGSAGFEHWRDHERAHLKGLFSTAAETVAQRALKDGTPKQAAAVAARLLADDPLNERAWRIRLTAEHQLGSHVHLVASIAELRRLLAASDWQPEARTLQLLESLERPTEPTVDGIEAPTLVTDMVGRGPLLALLYDAWRGASRRPGAHVHLIGRAGLGKSRVLEDFAARLRADRARVVRVRALPRQRFVPSAMLSTLVGGLVEVPGAAGMSAQSARILLPLHSSVGNRFPTASPLEFSDPDTRFLALLGALDDLLDAVSHEAPCCLLLDDAHWWDDSSRQLIEQLLDRLETRPALVVTASRPGHGVISASSTRETVGLTTLSRDDVLALVQSLGEHADAKALDRLADGLTRAANGVPLLILEAIRLGLDRELLALEERQWGLTRLDEFLAVLHPGRLLDERLALLTAAQRQLLLIAWFVELPLTDDDIPLLGSDTGAVAELERLGFLQSTRAGWSIAHDAIGEAVEAMAPPEEQSQAHQTAGHLVRRRGESRALLAQATAHFLDAGAMDDVATIATYWLRTCRDGRIDVAPATLLRELLGPSAPPETLRAVLRRMPADLQRRPWTAKRVMPIAVAAVVMLLVSGWMLASRERAPDAVLGILTRDASGKVTESQVELRHHEWENARSAVAVRSVRRGPWSRTSGPDENDLVKDPLRARWVSFRSVPPGSTEGPTELVMYEGSGATPIGGARGDDAGPSWSPDGTMLAFSTTRWSDPSNPTFNLGVLDVASGEARQLTNSPDADQTAIWSPDGTRIAFIRKSADSAADSLCWISVDGRSGRCRGFGDAQIAALPGWLDGDRVLVALMGDSGHQAIAAHMDAGGDRRIELEITRWHTLRLSPDGVWGLLRETNSRGPNTAVTTHLFRISDPTVRRRVPLPGGIGAAQVFWRDFSRPASVSSVDIVHHSGELVVGVPSRPTLHARDESGTEMPIPLPVVRWSTSDTSIAVTDSVGTVTALRVGRVTISASVGGWRTASREFEVRTPTGRQVWEEEWEQPWPARWTPWGAPEPVLVPRGSGGWAMLPNGDTEYSSGLVSKQGFDASAGLAMDVELQTPITQTKWQFLDLALRLPGPISVSGPAGDGCSLRYPAGEGGRSRLVLDGLPVDQAIYSGKPYTLRLQVFPDGSCGIAINGRAFKHDLEFRVAPGTMHVALGGETVASQLLIGRVTVWAGVPGGVDWRRLGDAR
jgi:DNA-binding SARP family transcriptional activator